VKVKTAQSPWPDNLATKIGVAVYCNDAQSDFNLLKNRGLRCDSLKKVCTLATTCGERLSSGIWKSPNHRVARPIATRLENTESGKEKISGSDTGNSHQARIGLK
jgi:hypothetical protein